MVRCRQAPDLPGIEDQFKAALEQAAGKLLPIITSTTVTWRLKALIDAPVLVGKHVLVLRYAPDEAKNGGFFRVEPVP